MRNSHDVARGQLRPLPRDHHVQFAGLGIEHGLLSPAHPHVLVAAPLATGRQNPYRSFWWAISCLDYALKRGCRYFDVVFSEEVRKFSYNDGFQADSVVALQDVAILSAC